MKKITATTLALLLSLPAGVWGTTTPPKNVQPLKSAAKIKVAPDLEALLMQDDEEQAARLAGKTLREIRAMRQARLQQAGAGEQVYRVRGVALPAAEVIPEETQSFIVQLEGGTPNAVLQEKVAALGGRIERKFDNFGLVSIEAPRTAIRQLAADNSIAYVSPDRPVQANGHLEKTTGAEQVRYAKFLTTLDGSGVGVAVIDSGIDDRHSIYEKAVLWSAVKYKQDLATGEPGGTEDPYGHGTHVAGLLVGDMLSLSGYYRGIAPAANLINLRVLDSYGKGSASRVIAALDWCVANKAAHNIRVINLSLGTTAKDSYKTDPLCLAARRAHNAGIAVVAAAGNDGKDQFGKKIYGGIHSPGIDPSVITVGASNTLGTDSRADDIVTTYSSRGPTRGYTTVNGVRVYDHLIKPDLVAPGNRLISAAAATAGNTLLAEVPNLLVNTLSLGNSRLMYMSGTSMSAPMVSAAIALMIEANPNLTPNLAKAILMYTAQPLKGANSFEQGAGQLNIDGAVRMAMLVRSTLPTKVGSSLLTSSMPNQQSTIAGYTFKWGQSVLTNYGFMTGSNLMTQWQSIYGQGVIVADATALSGDKFVAVTGRTSLGVGLKPGAVRIMADGVVVSDGVLVADSYRLAKGVLVADGVVVSDGVLVADGMVLSDGVIVTDSVPVPINAACNAQIIVGDNTAAMLPAP